MSSWMPDAGKEMWLVTGNTALDIKKGSFGDEYKGKLVPREVAVEVAKYFSNNFYLLLLQTIVDKKTVPPFVISNKTVHFYTVPRESFWKSGKYAEEK